MIVARIDFSGHSGWLPTRGTPNGTTGNAHNGNRFLELWWIGILRVSLGVKEGFVLQGDLKGPAHGGRTAFTTDFRRDFRVKVPLLPPNRARHACHARCNAGFSVLHSARLGSSPAND